MTKILLVEDNELNADMISRRLTRHGYTVVLATDGQQGVLMAQQEQPALILMDVSLPVMDGWEATKALKADPATAPIPVIALTAHALPTDQQRAHEVGCDGYETKPMDFSRVLAKIQALVQARATPDDHATR